MADTQRQRGGRVRLQNTQQQIRLHAVLLFWLKTDLRSNLGPLNCEKYSRGKCSQTAPLGPTWLHTYSSFSPPNLKYLPPPLLTVIVYPGPYYMH